MATEYHKTSRTMKLAMGLLIILVAILFWLVLREPARQANSFLGDSVSIRQDQDKIQWKSSNSDWQTITTVSQLTAGQQGKPGKDGAKGETGATGANGTNGTDGATGATGLQGAKGDTGATGAAGANGANGVDGAKGDTGATGAQGAKGDTGATGAAGTNGTNGTDGNDGREIELQKDLYYIQWRYVGEAGWRNLIAYSDLKGEKGDTGLTGPANNLSIGTVNRTTCTPAASITGTAPSQTLNLGIPGLPTGGTAGQVLQKNSNTDCDTVWANTNVIVAAGRPDIAGTMDASTQAKVTSATSGTEFRSTDGPQGAWVWMKQGSKWVVTQGDTGWQSHARMRTELQAATGNTGPHDVFVRRIGQEVMLNIAGTNPAGPSTMDLVAWIPLWMRPEAQLVVPMQQQVAALGRLMVNPNGNVGIIGLSGYLRGLAQYPTTTAQAWPTNFID